MRVSKEMKAKLMAMSGQQSKPKKRSKYGNRKVIYDGKVFDSKKECERYILLRALEVAGKISDLRHHVVIECRVNGKLVCKYEADFVYTRDGVEIVEDAKGFRTPVYRLKKKLVEACTGIVIQEV